MAKMSPPAAAPSAAVETLIIPTATATAATIAVATATKIWWAPVIATRAIAAARAASATARIVFGHVAADGAAIEQLCAAHKLCEHAARPQPHTVCEQSAVPNCLQERHAKIAQSAPCHCSW